MSQKNILSFCTNAKNVALIAYAFVFPISLAASNAVLAIAFICWVIEGGWREKWEIIKNNKLVWILYAIVFLIFISTLFSHSCKHGFLISSGYKNEYQFLIKHFLWLNTLFLILITSKIDVKKLLSSFLLGMFFSEVVSYLIFFHLIDVNYFKKLGLLYKKSAYLDPSPFMHHSFYSLFLAVSILLIFDNLNRFKGVFKIISILFLISATVNLFINGGRAGQFALIFGALGYALFKYKKIKALLITFIVLIAVFLSAYNFSVVFKNRINLAFSDIKKLKHQNYGSSWGQRVASNIAFVKIVLNNPKIFVFGCGAGDAKEVFFKEGKKLAPLEIKYLKNYQHLHNQYFQLWCDGSILAFILVLLYFFYLYKYAPSPLSIGIISIFMFSFLADVMFYRPRPYILLLFISAVLIKLSSSGYETSNTGSDRK
jgi:O-antigen ligase